MESLSLPTAARVGRDPNDASWVIARYPEDYRAPADAGSPPHSAVGGSRLDQLWFDSRRGVLELAARKLSFPGGREWLPLDPVTAADGQRYRSDPTRHRILVAAPCADVFLPLTGLGGLGYQTGQLNRPLGLSVDHRGWLSIADSRNHRVQVVDGRHVVVILGRVDLWGRPESGSSGGAMLEPTHAVVAPRSCRTYVADRQAGLLHVFDSRFRHVRSFAPPTPRPRPPAEPSRPTALAVQKDGSLLLLDAHWPRLLLLSPDGDLLGEVDLDASQVSAPWSTLSGCQRYEPAGEAVIGPIDGGRYDAAWHRIVVQAVLPPGTSASVQSFACNDASLDPAGMAWAPVAAVPMPSPPVDATEGEYSRLVLSDTMRWLRERHGSYRRVRPELARFSGQGPDATRWLPLEAAALPRIRTGDTLEFVDAGPPEQATVGGLPLVRVSLSGRGSPRLYAAPARLRLLERADQSLGAGPRVIYEFVPGETLDLSTAALDDSEETADFPHALAALLRSGDHVALESGSERVLLEIAAVQWSARLVELVAPLSRSFAISRVLLSETPGRLLLDSMEGFETQPPHGEPLTIRNEAAAAAARLRWVEPDLQVIWLEPGSLGPGVSEQSWRLVEAQPSRATDRGQFLWIRLSLRGRSPRTESWQALATPSILSVRALLPRLSYLRYLPALFARRDADDPSGALFLERLLALFEGHLTHFEELYESVSRQLNVWSADPDWLRFIATWLGLVFDPSWDEARRRQLIAEAPALFRMRGTPEGLRRYVEIYTGRRPELVEGFQQRPSPPWVLGHRGALGASPLAPSCHPLADAASAFALHAHRFTLFVYIDDARDLEVKRASVQNIVESVKPAHCECSLCFVLPEAAVGLRSSVGLDMLLGGPAASGLVLGSDASPVEGRPRGLLGYDRLGAPEAKGLPTWRATSSGDRLDRDFSVR